MTSPGSTVADLALATGLQIATAPTTWDAVVTSVIDADRAEEMLSLDGALVLASWQPTRPNGPLPDLPSLLEPLIRKHPAAIVVTPSRQVNAPRQAVSRAEQARVCLIWNTDHAVATDLVGTLARLVAKTQTPPAQSPARSAVLDVLHRADDLDEMLQAMGQALRATVRLSESHSSAATEHAEEFALSGITGTLPALEITRADPLRADEAAMVEGLLAVIRLHKKLRDSHVDDHALESARNLKNILSEDLTQREASLRRSRRLSLFPRHPVVFLVLEPFGVSVDISGLHDLCTALAPVASRFDPAAITIVNEGALVVVITSSTDLDTLARSLYRGVQVPLAVGVSDPVDDPRSYPEAFRQAARAVAVGCRVGAINRVTRYRDLGVLGLLYQLPEHARRNFVNETLGSVADETPDGLDQRRILQVLRSTDCNIAESARELFVHPNTLRSRIAKIETVTGKFMNEPDRRLTIFTALSMFSLDSNVEGD